MTEEKLRQHLEIVGWLDIIGSAFFFAAGLFVFLFFTGMGVMAADPEALGILGVVGTTAGGFLVAVGLPGMLAGWGILERRPWARVLAIVVAILLLFAVPIGTVIGLYALWVLTNEGADRYFEPAAAGPGDDFPDVRVVGVGRAGLVQVPVPGEQRADFVGVVHERLPHRRLGVGPVGRGALAGAVQRHRVVGVDKHVLDSAVGLGIFECFGHPLE